MERLRAMPLLKRIAGKTGFAFSLVVLVSPAILVFLWMLSLSLKNDADNTAFPPVFIPDPPTLDNFRDVFARNDFLLYLWNSILVTGGAVLVGLAVGVPAGYGIARARSAKFAFLILIARITPALSYLIPLFLVFQLMGLNGTITALLVTHLVITIPIIVWVMIGYFENVPMELEDAALVDGATPWQGFRHIALPLAKPGIIAAAIFSAIFAWNELLFAAILTADHVRTLPVAITGFSTSMGIRWGAFMATAAVGVIPIFILTVLLQRHLVRGLTFGAVK